MTRPRFSLRGLLLLTVAVAAFCWYRELPRQNAAMFAKAMQAGDYAAAEALLTERYRELTARVPLSEYSKAARRQQSIADWLAGRAVVVCAGRGATLWCDFNATAGGVEPQYFEAAQLAKD